MIKSFKQFNESINTKDVISYDEVEDQFLRLREVLGCKVDVVYNMPSNIRSLSDYYSVQILNNETRDIEEEIKEIKRRIETIYPTLKAFFLLSLEDVKSNYCYICNKDNISLLGKLEGLTSLYKWKTSN